MKHTPTTKFSLVALLYITLAASLISSCTSSNSGSEDQEEFEGSSSINGIKLGDSVIVKDFCCINKPSETGFHLPIYLEGQKGVIVEISSTQFKVRCQNQSWQVGGYSIVRFSDVCDSLGFDSGEFVMIGDSVAIEDEFWDEKIVAFRTVVGEMDSMYDLKYKEGQNFTEIPEIVVQSRHEWWTKTN
ncbi:MAG: hypothetical protein ACI837_001526 [Crocinitomicaceae bacterium]|jgi:hypothetical protein